MVTDVADAHSAGLNSGEHTRGKPIRDEGAEARNGADMNDRGGPGLSAGPDAGTVADDLAGGKEGAVTEDSL